MPQAAARGCAEWRRSSSTTSYAKRIPHADPPLAGTAAPGISSQVVPPPICLVDPGVAPREERQRPDQEQEENECDFHGPIIAEQVLLAQVEVFMDNHYSI